MQAIEAQLKKLRASLTDCTACKSRS
jgi:hypothetical protein